MANLKPISKKNKKAVSEIVGYVLLIAFGIVMALIAYNYLKTYVPKDLLDCPEGVSIFLTEYNCANGWLNVTVKNNGKFNIAGFYVHAANTTEQKVATINLINGFNGSSSGTATAILNSYLLTVPGQENKFLPQDESEYFFILPNPVKIVELTPVRFQKEGNTVRFVSCGKSITREEIDCS